MRIQCNEISSVLGIVLEEAFIRLLLKLTPHGLGDAWQGSAFDVSSAFRPTSWSPRPSLEGIKVLVNNFNIDTYESGAVSPLPPDPLDARTCSPVQQMAASSDKNLETILLR